MMTPWHPRVPQGCRKCKRRDAPHKARGLCNACWKWADEHGVLYLYGELPLGQRGTDSWNFSARHSTVRARHRELIAAREAWRLAISRTAGPIITRWEMLDTPPPRPDLRHHYGVVPAAPRQARRAA